MNEATQEEKGTDFEGLLRELNATMEKLERGNLSLEESIRLYGHATTLYQSARRLLDDAQSRLEVLMAGSDGLTTRPLDPDEFLKERS
ncbi:exodeoxyribonuclease VII small subunit [Myxococcota bacterium]|nr:exodeoxyribonuclease VII small subunit [Myxococcota bacterium]